MKFSRDIQSLSTFKRDSSKFLKQLKKTGEPIVLTVNGRAAAIIHDPDTYDEYLAQKEILDTSDSVNRGFEDLRAGRTRSADKVFLEFEKKYKDRLAG